MSLGSRGGLEDMEKRKNSATVENRKAVVH
jgi:hypothetical protein